MTDEKKAKYVFGIDLGTTYSCISYVDETGRATIINNSEGTNTTPSVVSFTSPDKVVVGEVAKDTAIIEPHTTISFVKSLMGRTDFAIQYNGENKSPEEVSSYILRKLASDAEMTIDSEVKDVVITCPAYFGDKERTATKNAGLIAGLNVLEIISEPTAAALYYGYREVQDNKTILVYDLGGGTFDVTIMTMNMSIMGDEIKIICSEGNHDLGGKDWDNMFMGYLEREFKAQTGFSGEFDEYAKQELRLKTEKAKQQLSGRETTKVALEADGLRALIDISRQTFDELTEPLLHQTIAITDDAIATARNKGYEINEILLVGGATKMPQVTNALKTKYGLEPKILEPDEAVAKGAAIYAVSVYIKNQEIMGAWVESEERDEEMRPLAGNYEEDLTIGPGRGTRPIHITFSTTKSYALEVLVEDPAGNEKKTKCNNLIIKNESMPNGTVRVTASFKTEVPHQTTVEMKVYESDFMDRFYEVDEYFLLGSALFDLPVQTLPKGSPVDITFSLSTEGILTLTGKDVANNLDLTCRGKNYATIEAKGFMSSEEVEKLREKSTRVMVT